MDIEKNKSIVWIVGKTTNYLTNSWEFQGVFLTEIDAVEACRQESYFVGPAVFGESRPDESVPWEGAYYPMQNGGEG